MQIWRLQTRDPGSPVDAEDIPCDSLSGAIHLAVYAGREGYDVLCIGCPDGTVMNKADIALWRMDHPTGPMA